VPAECDVSIRPGWFYHEKEDTKVRTPQNLVDLYYSSVGRGASLLLNLPVDRRGKIHENDAKSLLEFRKLLDKTFTNDLTRGARVVVSDTTRGDRRFAPTNMLDGSRSTYWLAGNGATQQEITIDFGHATTFNVIRLREFLPLGQRVEAFALDEWFEEGWRQFSSGTSIGNCRLVRSEQITTTKVRLRITGAASVPPIAEVGVFVEPK
jgi:alpha-L-fucosidase